MKSADAIAARERLAITGWIPARSEAFRHLPPPPAPIWLGDDPELAAPGADALPVDGAGWTLHPLGISAPGQVDAIWLDAGDATEREALFAGQPLPGDGDGEAAPFAWAHRAICRDGLRLRIGTAGPGRDPSAPVWLHVRHRPRSAVEAPLLSIELLPGAHCVLVEAHTRTAMDGPDSTAGGPPIVQNLQTHIRLGEGATLRHLRIVAPAAGDRIAHRLQVGIGRRANYHQALVASGSRYHLQRHRVELQGEEAACHMAGVLVAAGSVIEQQALVSHEAPRTSSDVETLALAGGKALAVVNARTRIAPGCDDASVRQRLSGVPTGGQPRLVLRPHLEIHHDTVQAVHGATWGALPEDALFYARQRGLDERSARGLIVEGMANAMLERCLGEPTLLEALHDDGTLRIDAFVSRVAPSPPGAADGSGHD